MEARKEKAAFRSDSPELERPFGAGNNEAYI